MADESKHTLDSEQSPQKPSKIAKTSTSLDDEEGGDSDTGAETMRPNSRAQRYLVAIEYIGTRFSGSQQQPKFRTVVGTLEEAFQKFIGQRVSILCSSRTDAGVHALSNVCHVDVERVSKRKPGEVLPPHEPAVVKRAVNHFLQKTEGDLMVVDIRSVASHFHARHKAQERTYFYRLLSGPETLSSFEKDRAWHVPEDLDIVAMQAACKVLVGHHDFTSFRATGCQAKSPVRTLDELSVVEVPPALYFPSISERQQNSNLTVEHYQAGGSHNNTNWEAQSETNGVFGIKRKHRCFVITARARSFLYHQVRLLVGVVKAVGTGNLTVSDVERILNAKDVTTASPMAPASGLYLGHVKYDLP